MKLEDRINAFMDQMTFGELDEPGIRLIPQLPVNGGKGLFFSLQKFTPGNPQQHSYNSQGQSVLGAPFLQSSLILTIEELKQLKGYVNELEF